MFKVWGNIGISKLGFSIFPVKNVLRATAVSKTLFQVKIIYTFKNQVFYKHYDAIEAH